MLLFLWINALLFSTFFENIIIETIIIYNIEKIININCLRFVLL